MFSDLYLKYQEGRIGKPLLWPVWIWTLHVPDGRRGGLNLLARTVLRLHGVGCEDPEWIADHIGIDAELVRYIVKAELVVNGLLDNRLRVTDAGNKALSGDGDGVHQRAILMFQCAESGKLWPRQDTRLAEIEPDNPQEKFPRFREDRDSGRTLSPFKLTPANWKAPSQPDDALFRNALRQDHVDRRLERHRGNSNRGTDNQLVRAIKFIDPEPRPAWVLCGIYRGNENEHPWLVSDPLGRTRAVAWMREEVFKASRRVSALAKYLGNLLGETDDSDDWETYRRREDEAVRFEVFELFPHVGRVPGLEERLIELLRARATVQAAGKNARSEEVDMVVIQGQRVLEECMLWSLVHWPFERPGDRLWRGMRLEQLQQALRYAVPTLPEAFISQFKVQPNKVFGAIKHRKSSLRPYLGGVLLSLNDHSDHPFRSIAEDGAVMLRILKLSHERDDAGHAGSGSERFGYERALEHADTALEVIRRLIEGSPDNGKE